MLTQIKIINDFYKYEYILKMNFKLNSNKLCFTFVNAYLLYHITKKRAKYNNNLK